MLLAFCQKGHALSDFAGQGKAPLSWNDLMRPRVDPSRYFATPGGGHGEHPAGGYDAPQAVAESKPAESTPEVKPDTPHIPMVPAPKPEPEPDVKPDCKPDVKPEVKPEPEVKEHKCWPFKFHTPKPECKHESVKPDKKPSCKKGGDHKSECSKPDHQGPGPSNPGKDSLCGTSDNQKGDKGPGVGKHTNGPGFGYGRKGGHGKGHGKGGRR